MTQPRGPRGGEKRSLLSLKSKRKGEKKGEKAKMRDKQEVDRRLHTNDVILSPTTRKTLYGSITEGAICALPKSKFGRATTSLDTSKSRDTTHVWTPFPTPNMALLTRKRPHPLSLEDSCDDDTEEKSGQEDNKSSKVDKNNVLYNSTSHYTKNITKTSINYQRTSVSDQKILVGNQRSSISSQRSSVNDQRISISNQRSSISSQNTLVSSQSSSVSDQRSSVVWQNNQRSSVSNQRPSVSSQRTSVSNQRPSVRSSISNQRSSVSDQRPSVSNQRSFIEEKEVIEIQDDYEDDEFDALCQTIDLTLYEK